MSCRRIPILLALALIGMNSGPVLADSDEYPKDPWFANHCFFGVGGCIPVLEGRELDIGSAVLLFQELTSPTTRRITYIFSPDSARQTFEARKFDGVYDDKPLWDRIGCYWALRAYDPRLHAVAAYDLKQGEEEWLPLIIEGLPKAALVIGNGKPLTTSELAAARLRVESSLPGEFSQESVLRAGWRFAITGHELIELVLGRAYYNGTGSGAPIDSVHIQHLFLHNNRILASFSRSRVSGEEEHVDAEPPQLDANNWYIDAFTTLGFLSLDGGSTWDFLQRDDGFEGIHWMIWELSPQMPLLWDDYLYTIH